MEVSYRAWGSRTYPFLPTASLLVCGQDWLSNQLLDVPLWLLLTENGYVVVRGVELSSIFGISGWAPSLMP